MVDPCDRHLIVLCYFRYSLYSAIEAMFALFPHRGELATRSRTSLCRRRTRPVGPSTRGRDTFQTTPSTCGARALPRTGRRMHSSGEVQRWSREHVFARGEYVPPHSL